MYIQCIYTVPVQCTVYICLPLLALYLTVNPTLQALLHPLELMSLVVGQQVIEWTELEKVSSNMDICTVMYILVTNSAFMASKVSPPSHDNGPIFLKKCQCVHTC